MSCKCDKDKFREEFIKEIETQKQKGNKYRGTWQAMGFIAAIDITNNTFNKLWKEYMED